MSRFVYPYRKLVIQYKQVQVLRKLLLHPSKLLTVNKQDRDEDWLNKYINHLNMLVQNDALYKVAKEELTV